MSANLSRKWNPVFYSELQRLIRIRTIAAKRDSPEVATAMVMPDLTALPIGGAKKMTASILFFDLANFTAISSQHPNVVMLKVLNVIIPTLISIVRHWGGAVEKNTGDGIMAVLGTATRHKETIAKDAIECAMAMRYLMVREIQPSLRSIGFPGMSFRIGIDMDEVLITRMGIHGNNFLTVVGDAANRASKLQSYAEEDGICIGEYVFHSLPSSLHPYCFQGKDSSWKWEIRGSSVPYRYFHFNQDWPDPKEWVKPIPPVPTLPSARSKG